MLEQARHAGGRVSYNKSDTSFVMGCCVKRCSAWWHQRKAQKISIRLMLYLPEKAACTDECHLAGLQEAMVMSAVLLERYPVFAQVPPVACT